MKLEKITKSGKGADGRWYDDACGTALAMELVGERWSLLVVRELLFGPRRFSDIRRGLPGISANVLTQRLDGLERAGILRREQLPPPAAVQVYALTDWGRQADVPIMELGRWAARSPAHDPTLPLSAASLMMSFRTLYAGGGRDRLGFRLGPDAFLVEQTPDALHVARGGTEGAAAVLAAADARVVAAAAYAGVPFADLPGLTVEGDAAVARRFLSRFPLPEKAAVV
jgi:DNA-binding HxlR family transcriptional regulator